MSDSENFFVSSCGFDPIYKWTAKIFTRRPFCVLFLTILISIVSSWLGLYQNGLPEFDDPYLGFEPRFTQISKGSVTLENLRQDVSHLRTLENYPGEKITGSEFRRKRYAESIGSNLCTSFPLEEYGRIALEISDSPIFSKETLSLVCYYQKLIEANPFYHDLCEQDDERNCCPIWSLPNYVTQWSNKTDCADIQLEDINGFQSSLNMCIEIYSNETRNEECLFHRGGCPKACHRGGSLHTALYSTMDRSYLQGNATKYTLVVLPVPKNPQLRPSMEHFQRQLVALQMPNERISLAGYDFGGKDEIFKAFLVSDLQYVALASAIIFTIVCCYTKSIFVTIISFGALILSVGLSYFMYASVFQITYFPFMNMLVTIIVLGIGTDSTLIISVIWQRLKAERITMSKQVREEMMVATLQEASATLFMTTCTTTGAFFASLTSSIPAIRCFSIFSGTAIIFSFILLYVCVPTSLVLSDAFWSYLTTLFISSPEKSKFLTKILKLLEKAQLVQSAMSVRVPVTVRLIFEKLGKSNLIWAFSFFTFTGMLIWSIVVVFYSPGFQLPNSEQFQLLTQSHPVERFDRDVEQFFTDRFNADVTESKMTLYFIWGVKEIDTGFGLNPLDKGELVFDHNFTLSPPENQKWMRKLCKRVQKQPFYDQVVNSATGANLDSCFMETLVSWMKRPCEDFLAKNRPCCRSSKYPYEDAIFSQCVGLAAKHVYRTPSFYFQPDIAGPKFFIKQHGPEGYNASSPGSLATFVIRVKTNVSSSLVYEKMDNFYKMAKNFFMEAMEKVPQGLENGFFTSPHFDFYDLQKSLMEETGMSVLLSVGLCFVFLWISSHSLSVAIGAVIAILAIVSVTSAVLITVFSWKLGVFESIAVTVAVGLSDFTAHHSLEYSKRKSVMNMTSPTFFSALATVIMGLSLMVFSSVLVYQQIGSFFVVLVIISWIYSVFFLSPILIIFDKIISMLVAGFRFTCCNTERDQSAEDDASSNSNFIVENVSATTRSGEKKPSIMMEKWRLLKKFAQETTV